MRAGGAVQGPMVQTCEVSGRRPVRSTVRLGAQSACCTYMRRNTNPCQRQQQVSRRWARVAGPGEGVGKGWGDRKIPLGKLTRGDLITMEHTQLVCPPLVSKGLHRGAG